MSGSASVATTPASVHHATFRRVGSVGRTDDAEDHDEHGDRQPGGAGEQEPEGGGGGQRPRARRDDRER